jgi:hypothetical protein
VLGALFVAVSALAGLSARQPPGHRVVPYLVVHSALVVLCLGAWLRGRSLPEEVRGRYLGALVVSGVVARWVLVPVPSFTTTDVERYLWDGAVALGGWDPYALPPDSVPLLGLRERFPFPRDHREVATCYPPLAVGLFALASVTGRHLAFFAWKALVALAGSLSVRFAWDALRGTPRAADVLLLALSPLLVLEAGVGGHLDAFSSLAVVVALWGVHRGRWNVAALAAGAAGAVKLIPGLVVVPLALRAPRKVWFTALAIVPWALTMGAAQLLGMTPPGSLPQVAQHWSFAAPLWSALYQRYPEDDERTRLGLAVAGLVGILLVSLRRSPSKSVRDAFGVGLVVSPVLYPWYGMPLASAAAFAPSAWSLGALAVLPLSYEVLDGYQARGVWEPHRWPMHTITAVFLAGVALDLARALVGLATRARAGENGAHARGAGDGVREGSGAGAGEDPSGPHGG